MTLLRVTAVGYRAGRRLAHGKLVAAPLRVSLRAIVAGAAFATHELKRAQFPHTERPPATGPACAIGRNTPVPSRLTAAVGRDTRGMSKYGQLVHFVKYGFTARNTALARGLYLTPPRPTLERFAEFAADAATKDIAGGVPTSHHLSGGGGCRIQPCPPPSLSPLAELRGKWRRCTGAAAIGGRGTAARRRWVRCGGRRRRGRGQVGDLHISAGLPHLRRLLCVPPPA